MGYIPQRAISQVLGLDKHRDSARQYSYGQTEPQRGQWKLEVCHNYIAPKLKTIIVDDAVMKVALQVHRLLGVDSRGFHPKGVDENDILCIAAASVNGFTVVSDEAPQANLPQDIRKCKIPAACDILPAKVACTNLNRYIRSSKIVF